MVLDLWGEICTRCLQRKSLAQLKEEVEAGGGEVVIFSGMHTSGDQLNKLTGMAAILRFPLPDLEDAELDPNGNPET